MQLQYLYVRYIHLLHKHFASNMLRPLLTICCRYGRSLLLLISSIGMLVTGVVAAFSVSFEMLAILRLILGIFTAGARNASYVYGEQFILS